MFFLSSDTENFSVSIGFPRYLKVEHCIETFCELKWPKVKKQLPFCKSRNPLWISENRY